MSEPLFVKEYTTVFGETRWKVQRTVDGVHHSLGYFTDEKLAYRALQTTWPNEKKALSKQALTAAKIAQQERKRKIDGGDYWTCRGVAPKRLWEGVTYEADRKRWKVQPSGPRFAVQKEAAECYAKQENRTLKSLELQDSTDHVFQHHHLQAEFRENMKMQSFITPGDLCDTDNRVSDERSQQAFAKQPGILPTFWVSKLSSTKDSIISVVLKKPLPKHSSGGFSPEVEHLYACLVEVAELLDGTRWPSCWYDSVNKTQFHWMNYWVHLLRIKVLKRFDSAAGSPQDFLKFDEGKTFFKVQPLSQEIALSLQHQIDWGRECLTQSQKRRRHRTVQDAAKIVNALNMTCPKLEGACNGDGYLRQWLNRCAVYYCMRSQGVKKMVLAALN